MTARGPRQRGVPPMLPHYLSIATRALLHRYGYWTARGLHRDHLEYEVRSLRYVLGEVLDDINAARGKEYVEEVSHGVATAKQEVQCETSEADVQADLAEGGPEFERGPGAGLD